MQIRTRQLFEHLACEKMIELRGPFSIEKRWKRHKLV